MFSVFKKIILKENMKLVAQNYSALDYLGAFMYEQELDFYKREIEQIQSRWSPGAKLEDDDLSKMLQINKELRRVYDQSPNKLVKSFDDEFQPALGWNSYFSQYL